MLESYLWESVNILRGPIDAADFKTYIFPPLFFKRISDVYNEETSDALEESGGDQEYARFPENHRSIRIRSCLIKRMDISGSTIRIPMCKYKRYLL